MSLNRYAKKRDKNEPEVIAALESAGCQVERIDIPCDLIVAHPDIENNLLMEVKVPGGKLTEKQQDMVSTWAGQYAVVYSVDDALLIIRNKISKNR